MEVVLPSPERPKKVINLHRRHRYLAAPINSNSFCLSPPSVPGFGTKLLPYAKNSITGPWSHKYFGNSAFPTRHTSRADRSSSWVRQEHERTEEQKKGRLQGYKNLPRRWHIQHQKSGTKDKGRNKWQRSEQERKCKQKFCFIPSLVRVRRPCRGLEKFFPPVLQRCYGCSFHAQEIVHTGHGMLDYYCFCFFFFLERKVPAQSKLKE